MWETSTPVCMQALGEGLVGVGAGGGVLEGEVQGNGCKPLATLHLCPPRPG